MQQLPFTIRRSVLGILGMVVVWFFVNLLVFYGLANWPADASARAALVNLAIICVSFTGLILLLSIYLYWAATLTITTTGLKVLRYKSLFWSVQSEIEWENVQEVTVTGAGVLKVLFGVGTILVQTASSQPNLAMNFIGNVDSVRDLIAAQVDAAD